LKSWDAFLSPLSQQIEAALLMFSIIIVQGNSMAPTLRDGERLIARSPLSKRAFKRGTIVTIARCEPQAPPSHLVNRHSNWYVSSNANHHSFYIKRIIGVGSDTVSIQVHSLQQFGYSEIHASGYLKNDRYEWLIPEGSVFVRRDGTCGVDSVTWGPIPITALRQIALCHFPSFRPIR